MTIGTLVYAVLAGAGAIAAQTDARVYPLLLPQSPTYPAITYQRISNTGQQGSTAIRETRYQINCWSDSYKGAQDLATAVKGVLEEHTDTDQTPAIKMTLVVNELDDYDPDAEVYRVIIDVILVTSGD